MCWSNGRSKDAGCCVRLRVGDYRLNNINKKINMRCRVRKLVLGAFFVVTTVGCMGIRVAVGQAAIKYQKPPQGIETLLEAPATPVASVSPDKKMMAMEQPETLSTIAEVSQPRLRLAGVRVKPLTNGQTAGPYSTGLTAQAGDGGG